MSRRQPSKASGRLIGLGRTFGQYNGQYSVTPECLSSKCDVGMSVENVPVVVNINVAGQFAIKFKSEKYCWTQKLNKEDYGVGKYFLLL